MAGLSPSNVHFSKPPVGWREPARQRQQNSTFIVPENARQGVHAKALTYALATGILLLLITYTLFGLFSETIAVTDLPAASAAPSATVLTGSSLEGSNLQVPGSAQQATSQQR